jgi:hypothetical protein
MAVTTEDITEIPVVIPQPNIDNGSIARSQRGPTNTAKNQPKSKTGIGKVSKQDRIS